MSFLNDNQTKKTTVSDIVTPVGDEDLGQTLKYAIAAYLSVVLFVGVIGNIVTFIIIISNKHLRTKPNIYIGNLAVADTVLLCVNLPSTIMEFSQPSGSIADLSYCKYTSPVNIMTMIGSLTSIGAVGFNRYLHICYSRHDYLKWTQRWFIALSIIFIWVWSFIITLPPYVGYGTFGYHKKFHTCFFEAYNEESWMYGTIFCCILGVFPTVVASAFFYGRILFMLKLARTRIKQHYKPMIDEMSLRHNVVTRLTPAYECTARAEFGLSENADVANVIQRMIVKPVEQKHTYFTQLRRNRREQKRTLMLLTIFLLIVICWLPISVSFIVDRKNSLPSVVYVIFVLLAWSNSAINIFIYAIMDTRFRKAYLKLFRSCKKNIAVEVGNTVTEISK